MQHGCTRGRRPAREQRTQRQKLRSPTPSRIAAAGFIFLLLASCGTLEPRDEGLDYTRPVIETALRNIDRRYATDAKLDELAVAGLKKVLKSDPLAEMSLREGEISIAYNDARIGRWRTAPPHDHRGWAALAAEAITLTREASPQLRSTDREAILKTFFDGGLATLDKYTRYSTPDQADSMRARREGFGGLGISIKHSDGRTFVSVVHPGTPAEEAGLKANDEITHVSDQPIAGLGQREVIDRLRGPTHSEADLTVRREGATEPMRFAIVRAHIILPTVESRRDGAFLYVRISGFNQGTARALGRALASAEHERPETLRGIILDLRANPGGLLDQAVAVSDFFLSDGRIISTQGRHERANQIFDASWGQRLHTLPIALLVNGRSASASEIVAAALRDRARAILVGTSSFGKGSVQTIIRLPNSGELTMTWAHLIAPSGFNLQGHGVIPAICTSAGARQLSAMMGAVHARSTGWAVFGGVLELRHAVRKDPEKARKDCPPADDLREEDVEIAKFILTNRALYTRALANGGPAIAERPE